MFLEDDNSLVIPLEGEWRFRLGDGDWRAIRVPSAWEVETGDRLTEGPAVCRRLFVLPDVSGRWMLECDGVSFATMVRVNGYAVGEHIGMWSRWQVDLTPFLQVGENVLELEMWKPGRDRYRLRESLAGFLPDVCNTFGGIWQGIRLRRFKPLAIADLRVSANVGGRVRVSGRVVAGDGWKRLSGVAHIHDLGVSQPVNVRRDGTFTALLHAAECALWSPWSPRTYVLIVEFGDIRVSRQIGFRSVRAHEGTTLFNGVPFHFRGVLNWGWDERRLCPTPSRAEALDAFAKVRSLGFNLFKLCLFVPDETIFSVADEEGMLLWLELPMWLPDVTPAFRALVLREYEAILQRVHHHPSIVIASLGCELGPQVDDRLLARLRTIVRHWLPGVLMCDNSGSGEAYGGTTRLGDFYDYHFYAELHHFELLNEHFSRTYLPARPWIYGEFCDVDTMRDWSRLRPMPFWVVGPVTMQRDELVWAREHEQRLRAAGVTDGGAELARIGRLQATVVRKFVLELVRRHHATGGYVVTGWCDTPIATSGLVDDLGELKFDPAEWCLFNADRVLVMDRERRRRWLHGGDRPIYRDPCCWWSDEPMEVHIVLSNGGPRVRRGELVWRLTNGGSTLVAGILPAPEVPAGSICELGVLSVCVPGGLGFSNDLRRFQLEVHLVVSGVEVAVNRWPLWVVSGGIRQLAVSALEACCVVNDRSVLRRSAKGRWFVALSSASDSFAVPCPFWRESVHVFPNDSCDLFSHQDTSAYANICYYGIATDHAIDAAQLAITLSGNPAQIRPLWRRFDARAMIWTDYVVEAPIGRGGLIVTTLCLGSGTGSQPTMIEDNPMGAWVLTRLTQRAQEKESRGDL